MMTETIRPFASKGRPLGHAGRVLRRPEVLTDGVYLLFTSFEETVAALPVASRLAAALHGRLTVIHFKPIEFGAPLELRCGLSPVETEEFRGHLESDDPRAEARVCLCRDAREAVATTLEAGCLVVLGRHRHWWPTQADRWRRTLEAAGHLVIVVEAQRHA